MPDAGSADGGNAGPVLDGELAAAVAAAAASGPARPSRSADSADGPPEAGVFPAGKADRILARGQSPKIEVFSEGSEPRVTLTPKLDGGEQKSRVRVALRMGAQSALPTIEFDLVTKIDKGDDEDRKGGKGERDRGGAPSTSAAIAVTKVAAAALARSQPGAVPKELDAAVAKLKGGAVRCEVSPSGGILGCATQVPKGTADGLDVVLKALSEALSLVRLPAPNTAVGVGAYWMVTDRAWVGVVAGVDALRYRVFKVDSIDNGGVKLSVEVRQYAATDAFDPSGAQAGPAMSLEALESQGKATIDVTPGRLIPDRGELSQKLNGRLRSGAGNQRSMVQIDMSCSIGGG